MGQRSRRPLPPVPNSCCLTRDLDTAPRSLSSLLASRCQTRTVSAAAAARRRESQYSIAYQKSSESLCDPKHAPISQSSTHFTNQPHPLMVCILYLYDNDSGEILKTHPFSLLTNLEFEERRGRASGLPAAIYSFYYGPRTLQKLRPGALHARRRVQRGGVS